tara:strand:- start:29166 stop:29297 length:132 start_codon:yes stop_codon:yes gene_type:complete
VLKAKAIQNGALIVNNKMETSKKNIYAAGDCVAMLDGITDESA